MRLNPDDRVGPYKVVAVVGHGGMGEVYRAIDTRLGRVVAIKVIRSDHGDDLRARFAEEARMVAALNHPNVCTLYDVGRHEAHDYLVMEYLEGQTLQDALLAGPLQPSEVLLYVRQLAGALAAAHGKGLMHRDLKPANIFLTTDRVAKILDFGIAKRTVAQPDGMTVGRDTASGMFVGTPGYAAPEQLRGEDATPATDLFALGAVAYEAVAGRPAFGGASIFEMYAAVLREDPAPLPPDVPPTLASAVMRCLRKSPGERFHSAPHLLDALDTPSLQQPVFSVAAASPSIAVLPFADLSPEHDQEFFCDGVADELITALMSLQGIRVASRTSAFQFRGRTGDVAEIGQRLKVKHVLEGSVRRAGPRLRVTVQLTDVTEGFQIWSERYDGTLDDVFAVQDNIARAVVEKLKVALAPASGPLVVHGAANMDAYNRYLMGRYLVLKLTPDGMARGMEQLGEAIALQPDYAEAHAMLAYAYLLMGLFGAAPPREVMPRAKAAAERALAINPDLATGLSSLAKVLHWYDWNLEAAERSYLRALELAPADPDARFAYSAFLTTPGTRGGDAVAEARRAMDLDPASAMIVRGLGDALYTGGRFEEAIAHANRMIAMEPAFFSSYWILGLSLAALEQYPQAVAAFERARQYAYGDAFTESFLGWSSALAGDRERAHRIVEELEMRRAGHYISATTIALVYQGLNEMDAAMKWYRQAVIDRAGDCLSWFRCAHFVEARLDERFHRLLDYIASGAWEPPA